MSISTTVQLQVEDKQFVVEMINALCADNSATTLVMNPISPRNPPVGVFLQNAGVPGDSLRTPVGASNDYFTVPFTWTIDSDRKVVVTVQFANAGTYLCRFGIMYQK